MAPVTLGLSQTSAFPGTSTTMALTRLLPITAPTPPRAARREGLPSMSEKAMPERRPRYSPTGPRRAKAIFLP